MLGKSRFLHDTIGCQPVIKPVVQPVVKPVWQPVWQPVGGLFTRCSRLSNRLYNWTAGCNLYNRCDNRFDNSWLYRLNGV